jgi:hypothetical protein
VPSTIQALLDVPLAKGELGFGSDVGQRHWAAPDFASANPVR